MEKLTEKGTLFYYHNYNIDLDIDEYKIYEVFDLTEDNDIEICILKLYGEPDFQDYKAIPTNKLITSENYFALELNNKPFVKKYDNKDYSLVKICVMKNHYEIILPENSSDLVFESIKNIVDQMFNENNINTRTIRKTFHFKVSWSGNNKKGKAFLIPY